MISEDEVARVAHLARLSLTTDETRALAVQLSSVLKNFDQVSKVDTLGVEPLVTPTDIEQFWRHDQVETWGEIASVIERAPEAVGNLFKVPPVVG
jgi:aspartyl-tRNA(Asn)/glutamyl-tRNA(Gln) amidotransferase subunit C